MRAVEARAAVKVAASSAAQQQAAEDCCGEGIGCGGGSGDEGGRGKGGKAVAAVCGGNLHERKTEPVHWSAHEWERQDGIRA